jgi:RNA recognition motif-containing protein
MKLTDALVWAVKSSLAASRTRPQTVSPWRSSLSALNPKKLTKESLFLCHVDKLRSYFSAFGPVTDAVVMKDPISRRSRGFGFITYADPICVDRALAQPNHILDGRRVRDLFFNALKQHGHA